MHAAGYPVAVAAAADAFEQPLQHAQVALRRWGGVEVFRSWSGPGTFVEHAHREVQVSARIALTRSRCAPVPGSLCVVESDRPHAGTLLEPAEFVLVYIDPTRLDEDAHALTGHSHAVVQGVDGLDDTWLTTLLGDVHEELRGRPEVEAVGEALAHAIVTRLLLTHVAPTRPAWARVRPLDARQLRAATALLVESLEAGHTQRTSLAEVAGHLGLGVSRFAKAFRAAVGVPPYQFLVQRRLAEARRLVVTTALPLAEIALLAGFSSQSHLTAQFRRFLGCTPGALRRGDRARARQASGS